MNIETQNQTGQPDWTRGWRYETIQLADGSEGVLQIPLTDEELLHPQEGYVIPESTYHTATCDDLIDMLRWRYAEQTDMAVFHDLVIEWDQPALKTHAPDIAVVPHVRDRDADRGSFVVAEEGTRPLLIIEVVSPKTRNNDRVIKVEHYAHAGVQEYLYIDHWTLKGEEIWEIVGFRLEAEQYTRLTPDQDGAIDCQSVGLRIGIENGKVWIEDVETGEELLTTLAVHRALRELKATEAKRTVTKAQVVAEVEAHRSAEARIAELEAQIRALQGE